MKHEKSYTRMVEPLKVSLLLGKAFGQSMYVWDEENVYEVLGATVMM